MTKFISLTNAWTGEQIVVALSAIAVLRPHEIMLNGQTGEPHACTHILLNTAQSADRDEPLISDNDIEVNEDIKEIIRRMKADALEV